MSDKSEIDFNKQMGRRITEFRIAAGLSRHDVALALLVSDAQLQKYEKGIKSLGAYSISILSKLFKRSVNEFFDHHEDKADPTTIAVPSIRPDQVRMLGESAGTQVGKA